MRYQSCIVGLVLWLTLSATPIAAEEPRTTPYRPTVSNPAELPLPGWIDAELGWQYTRERDGGHQQQVPYIFKFGFNEDWGLLLGGDGYVNQVERGASVRREGYGSIAALLKHRMTWNADIHFGWEAGIAHQNLDGDVTDYLLNGIYSHDLGPLRLDVNMMLTHAGAIDPGLAPWIGSWAAALGFPIHGKLGGAIEFAGSHQDGARATSQFLATLNYAVHPRLVLDVGFLTGLTSEAPDIALFAGLSVLTWRAY